MISVTDFSKNYGDTLAVQNLSFDVAAGSILGMLGPNSAGKTTTLRAMAGILRPVVYLLTGSIMAACLTAWLALLFPALGILLLVAWAFQRFDVSASVSE
jgi:ABC-type transporter Mla maintaining outer membrane lipid asymmetry ATPase subunit MlaF